MQAYDNAQATTSPTIEILSLQRGDDATAFRTLNEEWITRFFVLEPHDIEVLSDPDGQILARGGKVFLVTRTEAYGPAQTVGCVALIPMGDGVYELSKMAVAPAMRGLGIGRTLLQHAVAEARTMGASSLFLGSSRKLSNAVHLYESIGFSHVPRASLPPLAYGRADVFMTMTL